MTGFQLNESVDLKAAAKTFAERGIVQLDGIFATDSAADIQRMLVQGMPWRLLMTDENNSPTHLSQAEWKQRSADERQRIYQGVLARARRNEGFFYLTYPMIEAYLNGWDTGHPIHQLTELINSPAYLDIGRVITGLPGITKADAHACQYGPGHFLTRHIDHGPDKERRAAYVLGFTQGWQPDWGGLLLFLKDNQDVDHGFLPRFNNLTIFDINYLHTVTQVSTFAGAPRLTVTGWFRDDPAARPQQ
ncbi:MAG: 2OG-Fe(II) oxygenase family protein [Pseudomonadota bacterium]